MKRIAFSGTLDPITNGHMWVIGEARALAEEVIVYLSENPAKNPQFPVEQRARIVEQSAAERGWHDVKVVVVRGDYTARVAKKDGIDYLIRGIRTTSDFDYENLIQQTNVDVLHGAKTIFVMPPRDLGSVSSTFVKGLQGPVGWHWTIRKFVPPPAYEAWIRDWLRREWEALWNYAGADATAIAAADTWFARLTGADGYAAAGRHYHDLDHLVHGLSEIRVWALVTGADERDAAIVRKAFWFHDAVYDHGAAHELSNEEASARLWLGSGLANGDGEDVAALIRATDHLQSDGIAHRLKDVLLGADLAILGQEEEVYDAYADKVRREYAHVPDDVYRAQRARILGVLRERAERQALYGDAYFGARYHAVAVDNLSREMARLAGI